MKNSLDILVVAAHPDDAEIFCGGLIAKMGKLGYRTGILDLTRGELGTRGNADTRTRESEESSKLLGLSLRENLEFPDGGISSNDHVQISALVKTLRSLRPEVLVIPYERDRHPDHSEANALLTKATFKANLPKFEPELGDRYEPKQVLFYPMRELVEPSFVVDISDSFDTKMAAIKCFSSQVQRDEHPADSSKETLLSSALNLRALEGSNVQLGAMIGVRYGEGYISRSMLRVDDPIELFRRLPVNLALYFPRR